MLDTPNSNGCSAVSQHEFSKIVREESQTIAHNTGAAHAATSPRRSKATRPTSAGASYFRNPSKSTLNVAGPSQNAPERAESGPGRKESAIELSHGEAVPLAVAVVEDVGLLESSRLECDAAVEPSLDTNQTSDDFPIEACLVCQRSDAVSVCRDAGRPSVVVSDVQGGDVPRPACKAATQLFLVCNCCGHRRMVWKCCGRRHSCEHCRRLWISDTKRRFKPVLTALMSKAGGAYQLRLVTLTVKNGPDLAERIKHLQRSFTKLKARNLWKENVCGGLRVLEVTKGDGGWHPHYHVLILARYMPWQQLRKAWKQITKDSCAVDIRKVKDGVKAVKELFKYTLKDAGLSVDDVRLAELVLSGKRLVVTIGDEYKRLENRDSEKVMCDACQTASGWHLEGADIDDWTRTSVASSPRPPPPEPVLVQNNLRFA